MRTTNDAERDRMVLTVATMLAVIALVIAILAITRINTDRDQFANIRGDLDRVEIEATQQRANVLALIDLLRIKGETQVAVPYPNIIIYTQPGTTTTTSFRTTTTTATTTPTTTPPSNPEPECSVQILTVQICREPV